MACPVLDALPLPIIQAPMAGGPSTPELAAAVSNAGGLGFVAAGYRPPADFGDELDRARALTDRPLGVNVFAPAGEPGDPGALRRYAERLRAEAERAGVALGEPRHDDDAYAEKVDLLAAAPPAVVSFTFGCPSAAVVTRLREAGASVWVTVTGPEEAAQAAGAGANALVVQGAEAGGHRGAFTDLDGREDIGLIALLALVRAEVDLPLVATGGIATGPGIAAALAAGAAAAALGTAFMLSPEAGTSAPHREVLASDRPTGLTRAFTGRLARGMLNRLQSEHSAAAPRAYPDLHYVTAPLRAHGRTHGDPELVNLWAGQAHALARPVPAAELVAELARDARAAAAGAAARLRASDG
jgi:nitronate monooxygenase